VPPIQAHATIRSTITMPYSVNQISCTHIPNTNHSQSSSWFTSGTQLLTINEPAVVPNAQYFSNFLAQLKGRFQVDEPDGEELQIVLAAHGHWQYAIVRRVCSAGEDRLSYEENSRFTLCSMGDDVEAIMLKGTSNMQSLTWWKNDGKAILWRRMINKPVTMDETTLRRMSIEFSERPNLKPSKGPTFEEPSDEGVYNRLELRKPDEDQTKELTNSHLSSSYNSVIDQNLSDNELYYILQTHCKDPMVLKKVLSWGISRPNIKIADKEIKELGNGRLWVNAHLSPKSRKIARKWQGVLDDLKGAYQEVTPGVYLQPAPKQHEPGIQHRLRRNIDGCWVIEVFYSAQGIWRACTQELPNGQWVDLTSGLKLFKIQIVPMIDILNRMKDDWSEYEVMANRIKFLFNYCNQTKLNAKLKLRSLNHHIVNLRVKLEKQYLLSFAVRVANIADSIALEGRKLSEKRN